MGKVLSLMGRPLRTFNIESRAHKIISQEKPTPAPKHKIDQIQIDRYMKDHPTELEESLKKNTQLDGFLKNVYVKSYDSDIEPLKRNPDPAKKMPLDRTAVEDFEFGVKEPERISLGKVSLRQALKFISDHQTNAKINSSEKIALEYSIPEDTVKNILKYFRVFEVYIPKERKAKAKFAGPSVPRIRIVSNPRPQLSAGKSDKDET